MDSRKLPIWVYCGWTVDGEFRSGHIHDIKLRDHGSAMRYVCSILRLERVRMMKRFNP
jgi:hypothetical protein